MCWCKTFLWMCRIAVSGRNVTGLWWRAFPTSTLWWRRAFRLPCFHDVDPLVATGILTASFLRACQLYLFAFIRRIPRRFFFVLETNEMHYTSCIAGGSGEQQQTATHQWRHDTDSPVIGLFSSDVAGCCASWLLCCLWSGALKALAYRRWTRRENSLVYTLDAFCSFRLHVIFILAHQCFSILNFYLFIWR